MMHSRVGLVGFRRLATCALAAGIAAEAGAVMHAFTMELHAMFAAAGLHVASSLCLGAWAADGALKLRWPTFLAASVFALTLPILGAVGVCLVIVPAWRARRDADEDGVFELAEPQTLNSEAPRAAATPLELVLRTGGAPQPRIAAVMSLRRMDAHHAVPLLRVALGDPNEDVRLLAYALLEQREKALRGEIEALQLELAGISENAAESNPERLRERARVLRRLTEQHWELVHGQFVSGELEKHTLEAALHFGARALALTPDGTLALLLARMCLRNNAADTALGYLRQAQTLGLASSVLAPRYAEVAFLMKRFDAIAPLLAQAGPAVLSKPGLDAVVQFWSRKGSV